MSFSTLPMFNKKQFVMAEAVYEFTVVSPFLAEPTT